MCEPLLSSSLQYEEIVERSCNCLLPHHVHGIVAVEFASHNVDLVLSVFTARQKYQYVRAVNNTNRSVSRLLVACECCVEVTLSLCVSSSMRDAIDRDERRDARCAAPSF